MLSEAQAGPWLFSQACVIEPRSHMYRVNLVADGCCPLTAAGNRHPRKGPCSGPEVRGEGLFSRLPDIRSGDTCKGQAVNVLGNVSIFFFLSVP